MSATTVYTKDVIFKSTGTIYFGDKTTEGSWKIVRSGNNLIFYRYESGSWVEKGGITS